MRCVFHHDDATPSVRAHGPPNAWCFSHCRAIRHICPFDVCLGERRGQTWKWRARRHIQQPRLGTWVPAESCGCCSGDTTSEDTDCDGGLGRECPRALAARGLQQAMQHDVGYGSLTHSGSSVHMVTLRHSWHLCSLADHWPYLITEWDVHSCNIQNSLIRISYVDNFKPYNATYLLFYIQISDVLSSFQLVSQSIRTGEPLNRGHYQNLLERLHYHAKVAPTVSTSKDDVQSMFDLDQITNYHYMFYATAVVAVWDLIEVSISSSIMSVTILIQRLRVSMSFAG